MFRGEFFSAGNFIVAFGFMRLPSVTNCRTVPLLWASMSYPRGVMGPEAKPQRMPGGIHAMPNPEVSEICRCTATLEWCWSRWTSASARPGRGLVDLDEAAARPTHKLGRETSGNLSISGLSSPFGDFAFRPQFSLAASYDHICSSGSLFSRGERRASQ